MVKIINGSKQLKAAHGVLQVSAGIAFTDPSISGTVAQLDALALDASGSFAYIALPHAMIAPIYE